MLFGQFPTNLKKYSIVANRLHCCDTKQRFRQPHTRLTRACQLGIAAHRWRNVVCRGGSSLQEKTPGARCDKESLFGGDSRTLHLNQRSQSESVQRDPSNIPGLVATLATKSIWPRIVTHFNQTPSKPGLVASSQTNLGFEFQTSRHTATAAPQRRFVPDRSHRERGLSSHGCGILK